MALSFHRRGAPLLAMLLAATNAGAADLVFFDQDGGLGDPGGLFDFDSATGAFSLRVAVAPGPRFFAIARHPTDGSIFAASPDEDDSEIYTLDLDTGDYALLYNTGLSDLSELSFDPTTRTPYALDRNRGWLYRLDFGAESSILVGDTSPVSAGLAFAADGTLYGFDVHTGDLYTVDPTDASTVFIGGSGEAVTIVEDGAVTAAGELFITDFDGNILQVDPATGDRTLVGSMGLGDGLLGIIDDIGDCFGPDGDGDGVPNPCDQCPGEDDTLDADGDAVPDGCDNCLDDPNPDQVDGDADTVGDVCDVCDGYDDRRDDDADGIPNDCDNCIGDSDDADSDGLPDICDPCPLLAGEADDDGDGSWTCEDCDDTDPDVFPGAPERFNKQDDDCDGEVDEGAVDVDGDGWSAANGDCEEDNPAIHPGAEEICDGIDNNCDSIIDDVCVGEGSADFLDDKGCGCASGGAGGGWLFLVGLVAVLGCRSNETSGPTGDGGGPIAPYDPLPLVDPFIGTGGPGAQVTGVTPAASAPFGMTLVGPDTRHSSYGAPPFYHFGGYHWDDDRIDGFSHTHSHGMGINDYGGVLLMPRAAWSDAYTTDEGRSAPFSHDEEWAEAGWYAVNLLDDGVEVEIAATERGAHHVHRFPADAEPIVLFDLGHVLGSVQIAEADIHVDLGAGEVTGFQLIQGGYSGRFGGLQTHFVAVFDPAPVASGAWSDPADPQPGATDAAGTSAGAWLAFEPGTTEVTAKVAISYVDLEGARANLDGELAGSTFDETLEATQQLWRDHLSSVRVRGGTESQQRAFHTALYHAALMPSLMVDVDGRYRGLDDQIHTTEERYYSDFSLWDTFRTLHSWYILANPDRQLEMVRTLLTMTEDGGSVPRWPLAHGYTSGMVGTPADQVFAETWLKGIDGWDVEAAFAACAEHAVQSMPDASRAGIDAYVNEGYVTVESAGTAASRTLEFAWSDHALALWAEALGHADEAAELASQSGNWRNTWDADAGFFRGRNADGSFDPFGGEFDWSSDFVEGNAWHYTWYVPYDVDGMIELQHGGDTNAFHDRLQGYWDEVYNEVDDLLPDDWYWHGNEPVLHYAALGSLSGRPDLTAEPMRWILSHRYGDTELGLDGNDDSGTLSAWYLLSASGLYPVAGTTQYAIGSPLFERVELDGLNGTTVISAPNTSEDAMYVRSVRVDGEPLAEAVIDHAQLAGAEVVFEMSTDPAAWGG